MSVQLIRASNKTVQNKVVDKQGHLRVSEFFYGTIQGEGIYTGHPAAFLRLQGCTLNCTWCFGIKSGRRIPKITTVQGANKKLNEVIEGDILLTFDEKTFQLVETKVIKTIQREVMEWLEIKTQYHTYFVTPEHPFFTTKRGLQKAEDLKLTDEILHSSFNQKISYQKKKDNPMKNIETIQKAFKNLDREKLSKNVKKSIQQRKKDGTYKASIEILKETSPKKYEDYLSKISESKKGKNNPNWKGGSLFPNYDRMKQEFSGTKRKCNYCTNEKILEIHHVDENRENDTLENLVAICHKCHSNIHRRGYNFWNGKRTDNKVSTTNAEKAKNGIKLISIKRVNIKDDKNYGRPYGPKPLKVFNLTCSPYNSYLVDNMWVHNCDSKSVWRYGNAYSFQDLINMIEYSSLRDKLAAGHHLVITGGSPLLQQDRLISFLKELIAFLGFKPFIEIENECVVLPDIELIQLVDCWNNSPKLLNSGNAMKKAYKPAIIGYMSKLTNSWFKFVVSEEKDWNVIDLLYLQTGLLNKNQIILMPEGQTREQIFANQSKVAELAIKNSVKFSNRMHVILWNLQTGV